MARIAHIVARGVLLSVALCLLAVGSAAACEVCAAHCHEEAPGVLSARATDRTPTPDVVLTPPEPSVCRDGAPIGEAGNAPCARFFSATAVPLRI